MARIVVASGAAHRVVPVDHGPVTLGRSNDNTIVLDHPDISRHHCRVVRWPGGAHGLEDLNSTNGTILNGRRLSRAALESEDRILLGQVLVVYLDDNVSVKSYLGGSEERDRSPAATADLFPWRPADCAPPPRPSRPSRRAEGAPRHTPTQPLRAMPESKAARLGYLTDLVARLSREVPLIATGVDLGQLMATILSELATWTRRERAQLLLFDQETGRLRPVLHHPMGCQRPCDDERIQIEQTARRTLAARGIRAPLPVDSTVPEHAPSARHERANRTTLAGTSSLCLPITVPSRPVGRERRRQPPLAMGIIYLDSRRHHAALPPCELDIVESVVALAAASLLNARLRHEAVTDPMTQLHNRRTVWEFLCTEASRARRASGRLGVILVDLDGLKQVNDTWGHEAGDEVIGRVGLRIRRTVRDGDIVARWGGDEFLVVLLEPFVHEIEAVAERIRHVIAERPIGERRFRISASLGIAWLPEHAATGPQLLQRADDALYCAKTSGRDRVAISALAAAQRLVAQAPLAPAPAARLRKASPKPVVPESLGVDAAMGSPMHASSVRGSAHDLAAYPDD